MYIPISVKENHLMAKLGEWLPRNVSCIHDYVGRRTEGIQLKVSKQPMQEPLAGGTLKQITKQDRARYQ
ncbi:uncharacterized protein N7529_010679 [Penicillium soppii]|uniref:uncharacterized protein n=1 Tax=Penicillium soppii TaxID=69789 RepID=UPI0025484399|nr:uncharacterized protein N7529_010679 [Penicillium soppii]KAJ5851294.1 hypothetical protein N7529_010679 [Penicillium soppii]